MRLRVARISFAEWPNHHPGQTREASGCWAFRSASCKWAARSRAFVSASTPLTVTRVAKAKPATMVAATAYDLVKTWDQLNFEDLAGIAIGFGVAFLTALLVVKSLIAVVGRYGFAPFAWYRIAFGLFVLATWYFGWVEWSEA